MTPQEKWRDEFQATLIHIKDAFGRVAGNSGPTKALKPPDVHKISEGLFLSSWTHWEEFIRHLLLLDLASDPGGRLRGEVRRFRTKRAPSRLAEHILGHPDERRWIEWGDADDVRQRADRYLGLGHRYGQLATMRTDLQLMKTMRNAVAHKSDSAHAKFLSLISKAPFNLTAKQRQGITVGRFLSSHLWGSEKVVVACIQKLHGNATKLVK